MHTQHVVNNCFHVYWYFLLWVCAGMGDSQVEIRIDI